MTLDHLQRDRKARIVAIQGGRGLRHNLEQMGIHPGDLISVAGSGVFRGPILVEIHGSRVALGRGVAQRILVEPLHCSKGHSVPGRSEG